MPEFYAEPDKKNNSFAEKIEKDILNKARTVVRMRVLVGFPKKRSSEVEIDASYLAQIHDQGLGHNPKREILQPVIKSHKKHIRSLLLEAAKTTISNTGGNKDAKSKSETKVKMLLESVGLYAQKMIKARFTNNNWAPLAKSTIKNRLATKRNRFNTSISASKGVKFTGNAGTRPLLWTGWFRNQVNYIVKMKK